MADSARNLVYGIHAVMALLERAPERVLELWLKELRPQEQSADARVHVLLELALGCGLKVQNVAGEVIAKLVGDVVHQGVVASIRALPPWQEEQLAKCLDALREPPFILVLDGVTDPHNLGACLRTADAAGVHALVIPKDRSATLDGVVRKVAAGAAEFVPVVPVTNLARTLRTFKDRGIWVVGTAADAPRSLYGVDLKGALALVLGAEGNGLRRLTKDTCDFLVTIPMAGQVESLNVSVAAAVTLFEARRQRLG